MTTTLASQMLDPSTDFSHADKLIGRRRINVAVVEQAVRDQLVTLGRDHSAEHLRDARAESSERRPRC